MQMLSVARRVLACPLRSVECSSATVFCAATLTIVENARFCLRSTTIARLASLSAEIMCGKGGLDIPTPNQLKRMHRKKAGGSVAALDASVPGKSWFVDAYSTAEAYDLDRLHRALRREGIYDSTEMVEDGCEALRVTPRYKVEEEPREIYFFCQGSVVFWNVTELERLTVLRTLRGYEKNRYPEAFIFDEAEKMQFQYSDGEKGVLRGNRIILGSEAGARSLDKYTFSHALSLSVKLGALEATLDDFVKQIEHIHEDLKKEGTIRLSRQEVLKKLGALFALRHSINFSSELLDETPDFYWDREHLEPLYQKMKEYLNISKRTKVMNEKLSLCCDLMDILVTHLNDRHHVRLEWMIIVLIMVEVGFEVIHLVQSYH